jgi:hypothetical protein
MTVNQLVEPKREPMFESVVVATAGADWHQVFPFSVLKLRMALFQRQNHTSMMRMACSGDFCFCVNQDVVQAG